MFSHRRQSLCPAGAWALVCSLWLSLLTQPARAREEPRFRHLTNRDGLSQMNVFSIYQDRKGFLWFGTGNGLNRFDGHELEVFEPETSGWIHDILEDGQGDLWLGTDAGLLRFDPRLETFEVYVPDPDDPGSLGHRRVLRLAIDATETLWVGTDGGLDRFDAESGRFTHFRHRPGDARSLSHDRVRDILPTPEGELWLATGAGIDAFDPSEGKVRRQALPPVPETGAPSAVHDLLFGPEGHLWAATDAGLLRRNRGSSGFRRVPWIDPPEQAVRHLAFDGKDRLWIATQARGLLRHDPAQGTTLSIRHDPDIPSSLAHDRITSLFISRRGILWVGTSPGGVSYTDPRATIFDLYRHDPKNPESLGNPVVTAFEQGPDDELWIGTFGGGLDRFDPVTGRFEHYSHDPADPDSLGSNRVMDLSRGAEGELWVGTQGAGLARFDLRSRAFRHYLNDPQDPGSLAADRISSLFFDSDGFLWVGTQGQGIDLLEPGEKHFQHFPASPEGGPEGPGHGLITHFEPDGNGGFWIGTWGGGLDHFDPSTGHFEHYRHDPEDPYSLGQDVVRYLHRDHRGRLWIGTDGGGLDLLEPGQRRFRHFTESDGLVDDVVHGILEDDAGRLWLSTNRGLSRFDPETGHWASFDLEDGLQDLEFNFGACLRAADGYLYFGGIRGFNGFLPEPPSADETAPSVFFTDFVSAPEAHLLPRAVPYLDRVELDYRNNDFSFVIASSGFLRPDKNRYQYFLEGFDQDWSPAGTRRFGRYTNVPPGTYRLRARAADRSGSWSREHAILELEIEPPPWRAPWAYALYGLAALGLVLMVRRSQHQKLARQEATVEQLRELDRLKDEFLTTTSHALRTPLFGITGLSESLLDRPPEELPAAARRDLRMILASGRRLSRLVDDILDHSRLSQGAIELERRSVDLRALADVVLALSRPLVGERPLRLINRVPADLPPASADENRIAQVLHNLVDNAIRFTQVGKVEINAWEIGGSLRVAVSDSGMGIPRDQRQRIFEAFATGSGSVEGLEGGGLGLTISQQLVRLHGGELQVESTPGQGTVLTFDLPIARAPASPPESPGVPSPMSVPENPPLEAPADLAQSPEPVRATPHRILIVDDEAVNRAVLYNHLRSAGYLVEQASHGEEALEILAREDIDLVVLDVMMPRISGYEVCRRIRRDHPLEKLPILFLTAKTQVADLVAGLGAGGNDFLAKPIAKEELLARVGTHLELLDVHRKLARLVLDLEARNSELARFNYTVSHDLRNPLVTISNYLGVVRRDFETGHDERVGHDLDRLETATEKLQRLLDELFHLSQAGLEPRPFEAVALERPLQEAMHLLGERLAAQEAQVEVVDTLPTVLGDEASLAQMFWHLLDNALRFPGGSDRIQIEIGRHAEDPSTLFVRDNGRGIESRDHERIFGIFETSEEAPAGSNGIGLALVRRILEKHGGRIWVESEGPGRGSTFFVSIPTATPAPRSAAKTAR